MLARAQGVFLQSVCQTIADDFGGNRAKNRLLKGKYMDDQWDKYYKIASQEYESKLTAPYDYDEPIDDELIESYKQDLAESLMENL